MNYQELIGKALKGRSVTSMAKVWGVPQTTLNKYVRGDRLPDFDTALKIATEAGVSPGEAMETLAEAERILRARNFKLQLGFAMPEMLAALAMIALAVNLFLTPANAQAAPAMDVRPATSLAIDYAKWSRWLSGWSRAVLAWLKRMLAPGALQPTAS